MVEYITNSSNETEKVGESIGKRLKAGQCVAMYGGLGMGKTALTRGIARGLGIESGVSSPTFALVHEYSGDVEVYHFDMYRVTSWDDLYTTGFFDYLQMNGIVIIEWSENIENAIPEDAISIKISMGNEDKQRIIRVEGED